MKYLILVLMLGVSLLLVACSDEHAQGARSNSETALEHAQKHLDPTYICPMHPEIVRNAPGRCPICGMDLVPHAAETSAAEQSAERKVLYYRHPHNPEITSAQPRKDEMGMDFIPVYDTGSVGEVRISPTVEHNLGVRSARVERDTLWRRIDTVGYVNYDERRISHVHLRTMGWVEKLHVKAEGERVDKGQLLFEIYAPELVTAQEEFLQALRSGNAGLIASSQERLQALGVSEQQAQTLQRNRRVSQYVQIYAHQDGVVTQLGVREGMYVMPQAEVMSLADLASIWVRAEIFPNQAEWVRTGQPAEVRLAYYPGRVWEGQVDFVYPEIDPVTRTLRVRVRLDNPEELLKPNMFTQVTLFGGPRRDVLVIPREALIRGQDTQRVILALGEGRFQPRSVVAGMESGDWVEILQGLQAGEQVVTSGQFLIDSEASLKASLQRLRAAAQSVPAASPAAAVTGRGVLLELRPEARQVMMQHEPLPELGWPAMSMPFDLDSELELAGFSPQDRVEFDLQQVDGGYVISAMRKLH